MAWLDVCEMIFRLPGRAQSMASAVKTDQGIRMRLPVPGHPPYKLFWSTEGPRIEVVFSISHISKLAPARGWLSRVKLVRSRAILRIHLKLPHCLSQLDSIRVAAGGSCAAGSNPTAYLTDPLFHCLTALYPEARHTAAMPPGPNVLACAPANARHWRSSNNGAIVSNTALRPTSVISTPERGHGHRSGLATLTASPGTRRFTSATEKEPGRRSS